MSSEQEVQRVLNLLREKIRQKGDFKAVWEHLGWSPSRLSFILAGQAPLKLDHFLGILDAIEVAPRDFFQELYAFPR